MCGVFVCILLFNKANIEHASLLLCSLLCPTTNIKRLLLFKLKLLRNYFLLFSMYGPVRPDTYWLPFGPGVELSVNVYLVSRIQNAKESRVNIRALLSTLDPHIFRCDSISTVDHVRWSVRPFHLKFSSYSSRLL